MAMKALAAAGAFMAILAGFLLSAPSSTQAQDMSGPTSADNEVSMTESGTHTFSAGDFPFTGVQSSDTLQSVTITREPHKAYGRLKVDGSAIMRHNLPKSVTREEIDDGKLVYQPIEGQFKNNYADFLFKVSDGTHESAVHTMTIDVDPDGHIQLVRNFAGDRRLVNLTLIQTHRDQRFHTGDYGDGYILHSVGFDLVTNRICGHCFMVASIWSSNEQGRAGEELYRLTNHFPNSRSIPTHNTVYFTAPQGAFLSPDTDYYVSFASSGIGHNNPIILTIANGNLPSTGEPGWRIENFHYDNDDRSYRSVTISVRGTNAPNYPPTGAEGLVTAVTGSDYTFTADDFPFMDANPGDSLSSVEVISLPASGKGTLTLNSTPIASADLPKTVSRADIDAGNLKYSPPATGTGDAFGNFTFKVNDGDADSVDAYTMVVNVYATATVPAAPTGLAAKAKSHSRIDLSWKAPRLTGGAIITGYRIEVSSDRGSTFTDLVADTGDTATTYSHAGLDPGQTRHYRVSAINSVGTGNPSASASATTRNTAPTSADGTVTVTESANYTFQATDFEFNDRETGNALRSLKITGLPATGSGLLKLDGNAITSRDLPKTITRTDIDDDKFMFSPVNGQFGDNYTRFRFKVNDGVADSRNTHTMNVDIDLASEHRILVGNPDETVHANTLAVGNAAGTTIAQGFTTGSYAAGYAFHSVGIRLGRNNLNNLETLTLLVYRGNTLTHTLTTPWSNGGDIPTDRIVYFPAPENATLDANTGYRVIVQGSGDSQDDARIQLTGSDDQSGFIRWTIEDAFRRSGATDSGGNSIRLVVRGLAEGNTAPDAADGIITTRESTDRTLTVGDFNYTDPENDPLGDVDITSLPRAEVATLNLNGTALQDSDLPASISRTQLDNGNLVFSPIDGQFGDDYTSFRFRVNDGAQDSDAAYRITVDITPADHIRMVENFSQRYGTGSHQVPGSTRATYQRFRTGRHGDGYILHSAGFELSRNGLSDSGNLEAFIYSSNSNDTPDTRIGTLAVPWSQGSEIATNRVIYLTASGYIELQADTWYHFVLQAATGSEWDVSIKTTQSEQENGRSGWIIHGGVQRLASEVNDRSPDMLLHIRGTEKSNTAPTASNRSVTTLTDADHIFQVNDFGFMDIDRRDSMANVKIVTLPASGNINLNGAAIPLADLPKTITRAEINSGQLVYDPPVTGTGDGLASFTFKVNDGADDSGTAYTMTINVRAIAAVPEATTNLVATAKGRSTIGLSWQAPGSTGGSPVTGYRIEVSSDGGANFTDLVDDTGNPATSYDHTGLQSLQTRHYRVSAINTAGAGAASNTANATTQGPAATITAGNDVEVEGNPAQFTINLSHPAPTGGLTVNVNVEEVERRSRLPDGGDHGELPYDFVDAAHEGATTIDFVAGDSSTTLTVPTVSDLLHEEGGSTNFLRATVLPGTSYTVGSASSAQLDISDGGDKPLLSVVNAAQGVTVREDAGTASVSLSLDKPFADDIFAQHGASDGTASMNNDYMDPEYYTLIPAGTTTTSIVELTIVNSPQLEETETFNFFIYPRNAYSLSSSTRQTIITIIDDDVTQIGTEAPATVVEGDNIELDIQIDDRGVCLVPFRVYVEVTPAGDTGALTDPAPKTVSIPPCTASGTITFSTTNQAAAGPDRTVHFDMTRVATDSQFTQTDERLIPARGFSVVVLDAAASGMPTIQGDPVWNSTLTAGVSNISDVHGVATAIFTYQWVRTKNGTDTDIPGATDSTYTLTGDDLENTITVAVSLTDDQGNLEGPLTSNPTPMVTFGAETPVLSGLTVSSAAPGNGYYDAGDTILITARFTGQFAVDTSEGTPQIGFELGGATRQATYSSGSESKELVFSYTVANTDPDDHDGISWSANALTLNGGTITFVQEQEVYQVAASLNHAAQAVLPGHKVDTTKPSVTSAAVDGTTLTITFSEALDTTAPDRSAFTVTKGNPATSVNLTGAPSISGRTLTLTLSAAIGDTDTNFKVSYTKPSNNPVRDPSGKEAVGFSDEDVTRSSDLMVSFGTPSYRLAEGTRVSVTVVLSKSPTAAVTIPLTKTNQGGAVAADYSGVPSGVTFTAGGDTSTSFTFEATQDTMDDDGESVKLEFGTLPNGVTKIAPTETTVTIEDDDHPASVTVAFQSATYSVAEGNTVDITVTASEDPQRTISMPVWIRYQGGAIRDDYSGIMKRINLDAGSTSKVITVGSAADSGDNECEQVTLEFGAAPGGVVIGATGSTTIITDPETGTGAGTASDPKPIRVGLCGIQRGEIASAGAQDWYSFEAAGGQTYIIEAKQPLNFVGGSADSVNGALRDVSILSVTDNSDSQLLGEHTGGGFTLLDARAFFTPPQDGAYKVSIGAGVPDLTGTYTVSVRADDHADDYQTQAGVVLQPGESVTARLDSDVAPGDPYLNEWDWTYFVNQRTRRGIEMMDDRDMFRYEITNAGTYELYLSGNPAGTGIWYIWDVQGNLSYKEPDPESGPGDSVERHHEPGTYYVEVGTSYLSHANTGASYTLHLVETMASGSTGSGRSDALQTPTALDVAPYDSGKLSASWQAPTSGPTPTGYTIEWKTAVDDWEDPGEVSETGVTKTSHVIGGLTDGVEYAVRIVATRDAAGSDPSEEVTATPQDTTPPELSSATVDGAELTLTFNEALDTNETPDRSAFSVTVAGGSRDVDTVAVSGSVATLALVTAVSSSDAVTVDYTAPTDPAAARLQDLAGNAANSFSGRSVANATADRPNNPATGAPTITGTALVGETLAADTSGISDADGLAGATFTYQWLADGAGISGATGSSYTPDSADEGKSIKVRVDFTDDAGNEESLTSAATAAVAARPNSPATGAPSISGTVQVGETLAADTSDIDDADGISNDSFSYQWAAGGSDISGATGSSYTLMSGEEGQAIQVRVSFTDDAGNVESVTSAATAEVAARPNSPATGVPAISGTSRVGETLTASTSSIADSDGLDDAVFTYQWVRSGGDDGDIPGATDSTHVLDADDEGETIRVRVSYTDDAGHRETLTSAATGAVTVLFWSAALTVGSSGTQSGYSAPQDTGALSPDEFSVGVAGYRVQLLLEGGDGTLRFGLDRDIPTPFTIHAGTVRFASGEANALASEDGTAYTYRWDGGEVDWSDGEEVELSLTMPGTPLTAVFEAAPGTHDGQTPFTFELRFSEEFTLSYKTLRDHAFTVTAGSVTNARRLEPPGNVRWEITVTPDAERAVTIVLPVTTDCDASGAICTQDGGKLSQGLELTVAVTNTPATGTPTISGALRVGETLTADLSAVADVNGLANAAFTYQWTAGGADIGVATGSSHVLTEEQQDLTIQVSVGFTDDEGNAEAVTSAATDAVGPASANSPATGNPAISGTATNGETLTADTSGIADENGLVNAVFSYQWIAGSADIANATDANYTLTTSEEGLRIRVRVSFTDDAGNAEAMTSAATGAVAPKPNSPATGAPAISGTAQVGETLTADTSGIADEDGLVNAAFSYRWTAAGTDIAGATGSTYALTGDEEGLTIQVSVSYTDDAGNEETLTSEATAAVAAKPNSPATGQPAISGTAQVGETLTADTSAVADRDGLDNVSFGYQWMADDSNIAGATASAYTLADADVGRPIRVTVSFTDDRGHEESLTSEPTAEAAGLPPEPLTARFENQPSSHDGENVFTFELRFSEQFHLSYKTLRDHAFTVTGGTVKKAKRMEQGSNIHWRITVRPDSNSEVSIVLPVTTDCDGQGAICTEDGRELSNRNELTVSGPGG